jgi:uncharacterized protein YxeA
LSRRGAPSAKPFNEKEGDIIMKKLLTIVLALICMAVLTGLAVGQGAQQKDKQKNPPTSETKPEAKKHTANQYARVPTKVMKGTVGNVDEKKKAFNVKGEDGKESAFLGAELKALPKPGEFVEVTYTETSGVRQATTINITKSTPKGRVQLDADWNENKRSATADVERPKDGATAPLPGQGAQQKDKQTNPPASGATKPPPPKPPAASAEKQATENKTEKKIKGVVTKVDDTAETFNVKGDGKELTFRATALKTAELKRGLSGLPTITELKALLKSGELVEVTYTESSGQLLKSKRIYVGNISRIGVGHSPK